MSIGTYLSRKSSLKWGKVSPGVGQLNTNRYRAAQWKGEAIDIETAEHYSTVDSLSIHPPQCARLAAGCVGRWRVSLGPKTGTAQLGVRWPDCEWNAWQ